jgi:flagellin-like protein
MLSQRGLSPVIATVLLIAITVAAAVPVAMYFAGYYSPVRPKRVDLAVYAGLIHENLVRFHIQHIGGETIYLPEDEPTTTVITGWASHPDKPLDNYFYGWTFEDPSDFRQSDWAYAEVQLHGAGFLIGDTVTVQISNIGAGILFEAEVTIGDVDQIPGG